MSVSAAPGPPTESRNTQQRVADTITSFCGDMRFVYIHAVIFAIWIGTDGFGTDGFPFNFLTMTVSLEAIFLSTFILISQNRQQAVSEAHQEIVQSTLLKMLRDVIDDEKLDQANEELIKSLVERLSTEHVAPLVARIDDISQSVRRIETALARP